MQNVEENPEKGAYQSVHTIQVPASIANLGPGFDTLGVAVQLYLRLVAEVRPGRDALDFDFSPDKLEGENYIERAFRFLVQKHDRSFPSLHVRCESEIPQKAGLGSSAAATVAGLMLYSHIVDPLSPEELLDSACTLEGHPDNVSAVLSGGLTASCEVESGCFTCVKLRWPKSLCLVVLTPNLSLSTASARAVLPAQVARTDAIFNLQRLALLIHALDTADYAKLREAVRDRLHQQQRQSLVPGLRSLLSIRHPNIHGVCLSGAGPSIVALAHQNLEEVGRALSLTFEPFALPYQIRILRVHDGV